MPARYYRCQVTIAKDTGIPADSVVNVWSFMNLETAADAAADAAILKTNLNTFYDGIATHLSAQLAFSGVNLKVYDFTENSPRVPVLDTTFSITGETGGGIDLPPEVAFCLSYKAVGISGVNPRRRRGRVYLGPMQTAAGTDAHIAPAAIGTAVLAAAADAFVNPGDPRQWAVYSPYDHHDVPVGEDINAKVPGTDTPLYPEVPSQVPQAFKVVHDYWVDNAWDTQRRRGVKATTRTSATV